MSALLGLCSRVGGFMRVVVVVWEGFWWRWSRADRKFASNGEVGRCRLWFLVFLARGIGQKSNSGLRRRLEVYQPRHFLVCEVIQDQYSCDTCNKKSCTSFFPPVPTSALHTTGPRRKTRQDAWENKHTLLGVPKTPPTPYPHVLQLNDDGGNNKLWNAQQHHVNVHVAYSYSVDFSCT